MNMEDTVDPAIKKAYVAEFRERMLSTYMKAVNVEMLTDGTIRDYMATVKLANWSQFNRLSISTVTTKHMYAIHKTDMITSCYKATYKGTTSVYAYIYSRCIPRTQRPRPTSDYDKIPTHENLFVVTGPTFRSQDGEYRANMIPFTQFEAFIEHYSEKLSLYDSYIVSKMNKGDLSFHVNFCYPNGCDVDHAMYEREVNDARFPIKLMMMCLAHDAYMIYRKLMENHINPAYQYIMYRPSQEELVKAVIDGFAGDVNYVDMYDHSLFYYDDITDNRLRLLRRIRVGQKIFPLSALEIISDNDINFDIWREIYITTLVSNLVLNVIAPCFPVINGWFYIQNSHAGIFDNMAIHDKFQKSITAAKMSDQLRETDKMAYVDNDTDNSPHNNKFRRLSTRIRDAIRYSDGNIVLTDLSLVMTIEHVGRTFRDAPILAESNIGGVAMERMFTNYAYFSKHMFEFIYGFYCLNSKLNVMHSDTHLNNVTTNALYVMETRDGKKYMENASVAYIVNDKVYVFAYLGLISTIIDFSRAIIGSETMLTREFGPKYAAAYLEQQNARVLALLYQHFPEFTDKYKKSVQLSIAGNFSLVFKIITAIDTYVLMSNIRVMLKIDEPFVAGRLPIPDESFALLDKLITMSHDYIINNLQLVIDGKINSADDIEYPNGMFLRECFASHVITEAQMQDPKFNIVDTYNSMNDVTYDISDYESWGPLIDGEIELELRKKYNLPIPKSVQQWAQFKSYDESEELSEIAAAHALGPLETYEEWMFM